MRECTKCKFELIEDDNCSSKCKECINEVAPAYEPEKRKERYLKNKEKYLKQYKEYRLKNIDRIREKDRLRKRQANSKPKPRKINSEFRLRSIAGYVKSGHNCKYPINIL